MQRFRYVSWLTIGSLFLGARGFTAASEPDRLIKDLKAPPGFELTLFAKPPEIRYPTCLSARVDGVVFVAIDENSSLDAQPNRGRIVRCVDTDHDGKADQFTKFAEIDSPRGLIASGEKLYVLHPPFLSVLFDENNDGISDRSETLVKGIGRDLKFRGADHTTNGIRLGIDGYIYVAAGDYGFMKAEGTDGKTLQLRGGGVVRVRADGAGLEIISQGQRNIYDVAIDPFMNLFTRDNTNDGGGWDVRLSHVAPFSNFGYPSLFVHFPEEVMPPLADYGGGAPTGSLSVDDSQLPPPIDDTLLTCDWGRGAVYRHPLEADGSTFKAGQVPFIAIPRPTDIDIDGSSNLYLSSWNEGSYVYSGADVGYVVRLRPVGLKPAPSLDLNEASPDDLLKALGSDRQVVRMEAQRVILSKGMTKTDAPRIEALAADPKATLEARCAAVFTLGLLLKKDAAAPLLRLAKIEVLRESALRSLSDRTLDGLEIPTEAFVKVLAEPNPRVRLVAVVALGRLRRAEFAKALLDRTAETDPVVAHAAVQSLRLLGEGAIDPCVAALRSSRTRLIEGAALVLEAIHEPRVVSLLLNELKTNHSPLAHGNILGALCRLAHREAPWNGDWWGTRPDTSGPYFQGVEWSETAKIVEALRETLKTADTETARRLISEMIRNKVDLDQLIPQAVALAERDPKYVESAVILLDGRSKLPTNAAVFLGSVVSDSNHSSSVRGKAAAALLKRVAFTEVRAILVQALGPVGLLENPPAELLGVWQEFRKDLHNAREVETFSKIAEGPDDGQAVLAFAVLLSAESNDRFKKEALVPLSKAWTTPDQTARLLTAIGRNGSLSYAPQVRARLKDSDPLIQAAAKLAAKSLGLDAVTTGPMIADLPVETVMEAVQKADGNPQLGAQLFERQNCAACHAIAKGETVKGPYLGDVAARYNKKELAESILNPSAKIAQGFETQKFATTGGETLEGFVVRESGTEVEIRNGTGALTILPKSEIEERGKSNVSMMPNGLAGPLTVDELASILAYLESIKP